MTTAFSGSEVLVTGGTGSFGQIIVRRLLELAAARIRILSRDEAKQDAMREALADDRLHFITGDVRDKETVVSAMNNAEYVFHAAALKQVPNCERFPLEAVRTNVLGSANVRAAALECQPRVVVAISTDKACSPINAMGLTKALMEKVFLTGERVRPRFVCVRYGNVVGSRGSVVPLFLERIRKGAQIPITHPDMTRFLLCLPQAVDTAMQAALEADHGDVWVRKMPAATVQSIALAVAPIGYPMAVVGVRPGEKMHEVLVNEEEMRRAEDRGDHYVIGATQTQLTGEYTSKNTERLDVDGVRDLLRQAEMIS